MRKEHRTRGMKLGLSSIAFTVLFVAAVIVFNAVFGVMANSFMWYVDMTENKVFTLSEETKSILSDVTSEVNIYFAQEEDALMSGDGSNQYMRYIYQTALQLEKEFSNIHVKCVDVIKNPAFFEYYYNTAATNVKTTSVIIESAGEFRLMTSDAFFMWKEDYSEIWGYNGEAKFAANILQVTASEAPTVCFTTGHGERSSDESKAFRALCETAGYQVKDIDLSKESVGDDTRIIVINDPVYDFAGIEGGESGNEIAKIDLFLDNYGCVMIFEDSEKSKNLKNLAELLEEWGVSFRSSQTVVDLSNSVSPDGREIITKYAETDTLGGSFFRDIASLSSMPKTVLKNAMPIDLLYEKSEKLMGSKSAGAVLYSCDSADIIKDGEKTDSGSYPVMTVSREEDIKDNDYFYSYVVACGSPDMTSDTYLNSNSFANRDILLSALRLTGREKATADIDPKLFDETELTIKTSDASAITVAMVLVPSAVIAVSGAVVCIRRRRK